MVIRTKVRCDGVLRISRNDHGLADAVASRLFNKCGPDHSRYHAATRVGTVKALMPVLVEAGASELVLDCVGRSLCGQGPAYLGTGRDVTAKLVAVSDWSVSVAIQLEPFAYCLQQANQQFSSVQFSSVGQFLFAQF